MSNTTIVRLIKDRLEHGKKQYKEQLNVHDGRNWTQETLEEMLDACVYLSAEIIKRNSRAVKYKYVITMREFDGENFTIVYQHDKSWSISKAYMKEICFWLAQSKFDINSKFEKHRSKIDLSDVHVTSCIEFNSADDEYENLARTGWNLWVDDYWDTNYVIKSINKDTICKDQQ
tara:strand:- start:12034 stop:12555 length:522 start_codon:yes stop_codon:yes gene_type:complete